MEWISVKDKLPENTFEVLIFHACCDICYYIEIGFLEDNIWYGKNGEAYDGFISYWMPLPEPPKEN